MKRKLLITLLCVLMTIAAICVTAVMISADEQVVFVDATRGNDANGGTSANSAFKTLDAAIKKLDGNGGKLVLTSDYTVSTHYSTPKYKGQITITSKHNGTEYGGKLKITGECVFQLHGDTVFRDVTVSQSKPLTFVANHNPILFDDGFTVQATSSKNVSVVGGYWEPTDSSLKKNLDSNITVNSGEFNYLLGFTRKKGSATQEYKGTSHITVNGGKVTKIFGGSLENHYGGSTEIVVNGGTISEIHTAGDLTRRLKGTAVVTLNGGTVATLDVNNVIGNAKVNIVGTAPTNIAVTYASDTLKTDAEKAGGVKSISYNSLVCSDKLIGKLSSYFDMIENATAVFVAEGGNGDGLSLDHALGSVDAAYNLLKTVGGKIFVSGNVALDLAKNDNVFGGKITITGQDDKAALVIGGEAFLNTDTVFEGIKIKADSASTLYACFNELQIMPDVTTEGDISLVGSTKADGKGNVSMIINGGNYNSIVGIASGCAGFEGNANIVVGEIKSDKLTLSEASSAKIKNATLSVNEGEHKNVVVAVGGVVTDMLTVNLLGGSIADVTLNAAQKGFLLNITHATFAQEIKVEGLGSDKSERSFVISSGVDESKLGQVKEYFPAAEQENSVYVMSGATGTGRSPESPIGDLNEAVKLLGGSGKVVVCGPLNIVKTVTIDAHTYPIVITCVGTGVDYRQNGACINFEAGMLFGGETTIEKINFTTPKSNINMYAMANKLVIGEEVETELTNANTAYINLFGGRNDVTPNKNIDITINSGDWGVLRAGGNSTTIYEENIEINATINGGSFHKYVALSSRGNNTNGKINFTVNGGTFYQSIYAVYEEDYKSYSANYDIVLNLNGGTFYQMIAPACSYTTKVEGTYTVNLNGGNYDHLTDMLGTELFLGEMKSTINVAAGVDINAAVTGTDTFTNPVIGSGPDPWVFYYDGSYYYTHTTGKKIVLMKVQNISDIDTSAERVIIEPTEGQNMWSPEIHYFSAEEVGEENAGWYLYIGFDDGTTANQRQHVLKCLDGDNLLGRWGDPVSGRVNVPRKVEVPNAPHYNVEEFCGGSSKIVINGKTYMTFVSEVGRGTQNFYQTINITEIENPWTYKSVPTTICVPEYSWEMGGYGYDKAKDTYYPKVVEGASAVYSDNGDVYLMYTGSGYWTVNYQLGYLKFLGGDPMDANNWKKNPKSILSLSSEVNGCGHGSYFRDHNGDYYVAYHGYLGTDTSSGRYAHIERIYVTSEGITIGNGTGHPAPLATEYTITLNPKNLADRISGFDSSNISTEDVGSSDTNDDTTPKKNNNVSTATAIIIIVAVVVVVGGVVAVILVVDSKKSHKSSEKES